MKKHGIRLFAEVAAAGILVLTAGYFAVRYYMVAEEYADSRRGTLSRSYETLVSLLVMYRDQPDGEMAERIAFCTAFLPLSERSELSVGKFCADISASETDRAAGERAEKYCDALIVMLSCSRTAALSGEMPELPEYPEDRDVPTSVLPEKYDDGGKADAREAAEKLLGHPDRLRGYRYRNGDETVFGFRTASSYAEYSSATGRLIRAVIHRSDTWREADEEGLLTAAREFSERNGYPASGGQDIRYVGGIYTVGLSCGEYDITVGVTGDGEVCLFFAEKRGDAR